MKNPAEKYREKTLAMLETQLRVRGITDEKVLEVFLRTPREKFVASQFAENAYEDRPLPIGKNQTISQPYMVALMTQCLHPHKEDRILEIGTGSGYQAAILSQLVKHVYTIETIPELAHKAEALFKELGYANISVFTQDGSEGLASHSPFDKIIVTAGAPYLPKALVEQVKEEGTIIIPIGDSYSQMLKVIKKTGNAVVDEDVCSCVFVPLVGKYGWKIKDTFGG